MTLEPGPDGWPGATGHSAVRVGVPGDRLQRIARICEDYGVRVQYSVFECRLEADKFEKFLNDLLATIDGSTDRLVAYKVCVACARDIRSAGTQTHQETVVAYVF